MSNTAVNSLLQDTTLPPFSQINMEQEALNALDECLHHCRALREKLVKDADHHTWDSLIQPLDEAEDHLSKAFAPVSHLHSVMNSESLRSIYQIAIEKLSDYSTETGQHEGLYRAFQNIFYQDNQINATQKKAIEDALKSFENAGVGLESSKREKFKSNTARLSHLSTCFENNLMDATMGWHYHTENVSELDGLADHVLDTARQKAKKQNKEGYILGLDMPTYAAVMTTASNRRLRHLFYYEFNTRASDEGSNGGQWDNQPIMEEILKLRHQQAQLLGYQHYADLSLDEKMAESPQQVLSFLYELAEQSKPKAKEELEAIKQFAYQADGLETFEPWDMAYYFEQYKKRHFGVSQEALRAYFPLPKVLNGLFHIVYALYGIDCVVIDDFDRYHPDVQLIQLSDAHGKRGYVMLDLYARDHKKGGAWMDECRTRYVRSDGHVQLPVSFLVCNFAPYGADQIARITHDDVLTLFHEFGHALHHVLTQVDYLPVSGINGVEWDFVETPSQFMEHFCWNKTCIQMISEHENTGEKLPSDLFEKLNASKNLDSGMQMMKQLEFSLFDLKLHMQNLADPEAKSIQQILDEVRQEVAVMIPPAFNRFQHNFTHIFAGPYAAGYYSYKWAEVLASDVFDKFEKNAYDHNVLNREVGIAFLNEVLEKGGSQHAKELFENFREREPSVNPLLRYAGICKD
jgi:oligopeptidase A